MNMPIRRNGHGSGFSLIEILIAVVILATGLLALTALQGKLAQASAEAKTRSRVAAMLTSRMDQLRGAQYDSLPTGAGTGSATSTQTCASGAPVWLCAAQTESGVGSLSVTQSVVRYGSAIGAAAFTFPDSSAPANLAIPEFKRITLSATWTDASAANHTLAINSDVSPMTLRDDRFPTDSDSGTAGGNAIVRQDNPAGPGVIPIAIGGGDATAASNPRPEVIGRNNNASIVGTRFDVLTYQGLSGAAVIQRRVETAAVACTCQYGAGGNNLPVIYRQAKWPAEWTGERYEVADPGSAAPGDALASGPASGVEQSPLCTECCRDHQDATGNAVKFDPERTSAYAHYDASMTAVAATAGNQYIEACRLVRVDGFWRTATDMYAKHFALINTKAVAGVAAKSGEPDATAVTNYQAAVKSYLAGYTGAASNIGNLADGGQVSGFINISAPPPIDERYLHARGLYVDYLNQKAMDRITQARLPANCTGGDYTECTLPYLPFTTINATELSFWEPQVSGVKNTGTLTVTSGSSLIYNPLLPTRGRTNALSSASNGASVDAAAKISRSNAGVAIASPVDPDDAAATGSDKQEFHVVASGSTAGQNFTVQLIGLPQTADTSTSNDPAVAWTNATGSANCNASFANNGDKNPNDYSCNTYGALGISTTVRIANYFREYTVSQSMTFTCAGETVASTDNVARPTFANYALSSAAIGATNALTITPTNDTYNTEYSDATFASVASGARVDATFSLTTTQQATIVSCTTNGGHNQINNIVWSKPWVPTP